MEIEFYPMILLSSVYKTLNKSSTSLRAKRSDEMQELIETAKAGKIKGLGYEDGYFLLGNDFELPKKKNLERNQNDKLKELNKYCYFCDFDVVINLHHIIHKNHGGLDEQDNLIPLCPNCHSMIHKRIYVICYNNGFFCLINPVNYEKKIFPMPRQRQLERGFPYSSLKKAEKEKKLFVTEKDTSIQNIT